MLESIDDYIKIRLTLFNRDRGSTRSASARNREGNRFDSRPGTVL